MSRVIQVMVVWQVNIDMMIHLICRQVKHAYIIQWGFFPSVQEIWKILWKCWGIKVKEYLSTYEYKGSVRTLSYSPLNALWPLKLFITSHSTVSHKATPFGLNLFLQLTSTKQKCHAPGNNRETLNKILTHTWHPIVHLIQALCSKPKVSIL